MIQIVWVESRETVETTAFPLIEICLPTHFLHPDFGIHTIQNRSGMGHQGARKSLKVPYLHNNPNNSKSSCPQGHVGSNPTRCARLEVSIMARFPPRGVKLCCDGNFLHFPPRVQRSESRRGTAERKRRSVYVIVSCGRALLQEHTAHCSGGLLLSGEVQVRVDIGGGGEGAVSQPELNLLHGNAAAQQQTRASVT